MKTVALAVLAGALALSTSGCFFKRKKPAPVAATPPAPKPEPVVLPAPPPPKIEDAMKPKTGDAPAISTAMPDPPKPPQTKKPVRRTRRNASASQPAKPTAGEKLPTADPGTTANGEGQPAQPANPLRLGEFLSESQKADIQRQFEQTMQRARQSLEKLTARRLEGAAAESVERVKAFLLQADQARARDPQTALQLAQRADVLATDLLNR
ncbi:hypothetical protein F183_A20220 [Bryobacterales bacterium F-183]|nr:hypothetical protein F183_A20220 [Bryobacterales bacterium F-183]